MKNKVKPHERKALRLTQLNCMEVINSAISDTFEYFSSIYRKKQKPRTAQLICVTVRLQQRGWRPLMSSAGDASPLTARGGGWNQITAQKCQICISTKYITWQHEEACDQCFAFSEMFALLIRGTCFYATLRKTEG